MAHEPVPGWVRARLLQTAASLAYRQGDWQATQQWLDESLALYQVTTDRAGAAGVLFDLGWIARETQDAR